MKIGLIAQTDHDNYGDILIVAIYIDWINEIFNQQPIVFNPSQIFVNRLTELNCSFQAEHDLTSFSKKIELGIFCGGGYLGRPDYSDIFWQIKWKKNPIFLLVAKELLKSNKPYYLEGAEIGPGLKPFVIKDAKKIINNARSVCTRNLGSFEYLNRNFNNKKTDYVPDVVLNIPQIEKYSKALKSEKKHELAIHMTGKILASNPISQNYKKILIKSIKNNNIKNILLLNDQPYNEERKDQVFKFAETLQLISDIEIAEYDGVIPTMIQISSAKKLITSKLHLGVTALLSKSDSLCIASHPKLYRFYKDIGKENDYVNIYQTTNNKKQKIINEYLQRKTNREINFEHINGESPSKYKNNLLNIKKSHEN